MKYLRFNIGIRKFEFVAKAQFLSEIFPFVKKFV